jgi:hypothetical protein
VGTPPLLIRPLTAADVDAFYGLPVKWPAAGLAVEDGGKVVAVGGFAWRDDGCFGFLDCGRQYMPAPRRAIRLARMVISAVKQSGEDVVFTARDASVPKSEKFLRALGFTPHSVVDGVEVWSA